MSQTRNITSRGFTADDAWSFNGGTHLSAWEVLGAHPSVGHDDGAADTVTFRVWAPNARAVHVVGEFNHWTTSDDYALQPDPSGVWRGTAPGQVGQTYKYRIQPQDGPAFDKADPFGFAHEEPPRTASIITELGYDWGDGDWMAGRGDNLAFDRPISIYELHLGSWRYEPGGYPALAEQLVAYIAETGFTHVQLLPVTEHPFYGSWGYQTTGYFAPSARYGEPSDFMALVDRLHQAGIGVILDWVPSHFPSDPHGLATFDGTHLFDHADPRMGYHPDWNSCIFNYDRNEVRSFLLSSAHFWASVYHVDGLRVDAVASMLYRDYSRKDGDWIPNEQGGNENLGAVSLLQELNRTLYERYPGLQVIAEESTAWPGVTKPVDAGGLGFGYKWDMGWMHDTLHYMKRDPIHRRHHHNELTFRSVYQSSENYVLPLSHDEVVHGKGSLYQAMPGDHWQKLANLRLLYGYQWAVPGKKLLFMGGEFGHLREWQHETELDWGLLADDAHRSLRYFVTKLNELYRAERSMYVGDCGDVGFTWIIGDDDTNSVFAFLRHPPGSVEGTEEVGAGGDGASRPILITVNMTPVPRHDYHIGVPVAGTWKPLLESDHTDFGGSGIVNPETLDTVEGSAHQFDQALDLKLGPLAIGFYTPAD